MVDGILMKLLNHPNTKLIHATEFRKYFHWSSILFIIFDR